MQKSFEIKAVKPEHYSQLKELWITCFPDEDKAVLNNFFEKSVTPECVIATFSGDRLVNAMYLLESEIVAERKRYKAIYVYGVCTHPEYRGKGLMKTAFRYLDESATEKNIDYLFLVPAEDSLFGMYEKLGYKVGFAYEKSDVRFDEIFFKEQSEALTFEKYVQLRKKHCSDFSGYAILGKNAFNSFYLPVGEDMKVTCNNNGYCVFSIDNEKIIVFEHFCRSGFKLPFSGDYNKKYSVELRKPSSNGNGIPFGMYKSLGNAPELKNAFFGVPYGG
ncbi:MAG: GNAT family N-acetyltransferase [Clostridia bacterium]|nr:GNAT family N-acetyltransferase [Clostridia bacterium]